MAYSIIFATVPRCDRGSLPLLLEHRLLLTKQFQIEFLG